MVGSEVVKKHTPKELSKLTDSFHDSINDVVNTLVVNGYSRTYENEADKYALNILTKTSYADSAMISMLKKMEKRLENDTRGFASTHPKASERIEFLYDLNKDFINKPLLIRSKRFKSYT